MKQETKRSKKINEIATIECPIHDKQDTYDLFHKKKDKWIIIGIGCRRCFNKLNIVKL